MKSKNILQKFVTIILSCLLLGCTINSFEEEKAFEHVLTQVAFGPRIPGTIGSSYLQNYLISELSDGGWIVEKQEFIYKNTSINNIIAKNSPSHPNIILGTHYDTRILSDRDPDPDKRTTPVPGANDGASGTAILLELSRHLLKNDQNIWIVFFDAEDQGNIDGWDWSVGSQYFAENLTNYPEEVIIIDMVGDKDLNIYYEINSSTALSQRIWKIADETGYSEVFIKKEKYSIIDDHLPFIDKEIPAVLIIDIDYEMWHTTQDDVNYVSAESLGKVGNVILKYLRQK
jgi:Zn-dependent M28 family amino/carboxypeptidase